MYIYPKVGDLTCNDTITSISCKRYVMNKNVRPLPTTVPSPAYSPKNRDFPILRDWYPHRQPDRKGRWRRSIVPCDS
ncbi:hypothetical protein PISMIDRAFT_497617 [Pisolithus microcarpus 441]|uniref:Uncharacterized protein n=1 Tax=Pisolithus microcarpus 441 TaxID=765257 RepID=A0A0C9ZRZ4_9AGAM|nr:hypothetical protein PISMIDRAFT_497617 [Pisolithus microcarpus 441]